MSIQVDLLDFTRIVVGVDPAITSGEDADETGIIVAARGPHQPLTCQSPYCEAHGYVLQDASLPAAKKNSIDRWAKRVVEMYDEWNASLVVIEGNQGQELLDSVLRTIRPGIPVKRPNAKESKFARAEPIVGLYEQGRIHHVGDPLHFVKLEDQMCVIEGTLVETARGQIPIEEVMADDWVMTRNGYAPILWAGRTGTVTELVTVTHAGGSVVCTPCHPLFVDRKFVNALSVQAGQSLLVSRNWEKRGSQLHGADAGITSWHRDTIGIPRGCFSIEPFGRDTATYSTEQWSFITSTTTPPTTVSKILYRSRASSTQQSTRKLVASLRTRRSNDAETHNFNGSDGKARASFALNVVHPFTRVTCEPSLALQSAVESVKTDSKTNPVAVFNLQVVDGYLPEFYANGVLVHNCSWVPPAPGKRAVKSPDRVDALVYALAELNLQGRPPRRSAGTDDDPWGPVGFSQVNPWSI